MVPTGSVRALSREIAGTGLNSPEPHAGRVRAASACRGRPVCWSSPQSSPLQPRDVAPTLTSPLMCYMIVAKALTITFVKPLAALLFAVPGQLQSSQTKTGPLRA